MLTVIIPAFNEEKNIGVCLKALAAQKTNYHFSVIIVDNNSTDNTAKVAQSFADKLNIRIILEKKKGRGVARAAGFAAAKSPLLLSTDADTEVPPDWVERLAQELEKPAVRAVTGPSKLVDCGPVTNAFFNVCMPVGMRLYNILFGHYWLSGFNFGITRELYEYVGGFDPALNAMEDIDLGFKVSKVAKAVFLPNVPVIFSGRRFQGNFIAGVYSYLQPFFSYMLGKKSVYLSDPR